MLHWICPFGYMIGKVPTLCNSLEKGRSFPRTFMRIPCPSQDLHIGLHSELNSFFRVHDGKGPCPLGGLGRKGVFHGLTKPLLFNWYKVQLRFKLLSLRIYFYTGFWILLFVSYSGWCTSLTFSHNFLHWRFILDWHLGFELLTITAQIHNYDIQGLSVNIGLITVVKSPLKCRNSINSKHCLG